MAFLSRIFAAILCWFSTLLAAMVIMSHYTQVMPVLPNLGEKLIFVLGAGIATIALLVTTLVFWLWVWTKAYRL